MPTLNRGAIGGVRACWTESPGPVTAGLTLRVGRADETLPQGGITHFVEHLALQRLHVDAPAYRFNGQVRLFTTDFVVNGKREDITPFIEVVSQGLNALPIDRLEAERQVLLTEGSGGRANPPAALLAARYGASGVGLNGYEQLGLRWLAADQLTAWSQRAFTTGNALLWMTCQPPPDLTLDLPIGDALPRPDLNPLELRLPAWSTNEGGWVGLGMLVDRTAHAARVAALLARAIHRRLRGELGIVYSAEVDYQPLSPDVAHVAAWSPCLPANALQVASELVGVVDRLARDGPVEAELQAFKTLPSPQPEEAVGARELAFALRDFAFGKPPGRVEPDEVELDHQSVLVTLRLAWPTLICSIPQRMSLGDDRFAPAWDWSKERITGGTRFRKSASSELVTIAPHGLSYEQLALKRMLTFRFDDCPGVLWWPEGTRTIVRRDGTELRLDPRQWGTEPINLIDSLIETAKFVPMVNPATMPPPKPPAKGLPGTVGVLLVTAGVLLAIGLLGLVTESHASTSWSLVGASAVAAAFAGGERLRLSLRSRRAARIRKQIESDRKAAAD